jgi:hypothetical protein
MTDMEGNELRFEEVSVDLDLGAIEYLQQRLSRWRKARDLEHDWERGTPTTWIADLLNGWHQFDVDALIHYRAQIEAQHVHAVRVVGSGPRPLPLLLTHGWPGSFLEWKHAPLCFWGHNHVLPKTLRGHVRTQLRTLDTPSSKTFGPVARRRSNAMVSPPLTNAGQGRSERVALLLPRDLSPRQMW